MDLRMPGMDGVSAINRQSVREGLAASVIVLTTYDTDGDVLRAIEAGAGGYLLKDAREEEHVPRRPRRRAEARRRSPPRSRRDSSARCARQ